MFQVIKLLACGGFLVGLFFLVAGTPLNEKDLLGKTQAQVRQEYGAPYRMFEIDKKQVRWQYNHGIIGTASLVIFENGVVVKVKVRY